MSQPVHLGVISDIHYASPAEQARGDDHELACIPNPLLRLFVRIYRHFIWLREPMHKNYLLDRFFKTAPPFDYLVGNGDYSCDSAYTGLSDDAAFQSAELCLQKMRQQYEERLRLVFGDHELGKLSLFGGRGGLRLKSWEQATAKLKLEPFWEWQIGRYTLVAVVSSLMALPVFEPDILPEEKERWFKLREAHLEQVRNAFSKLASDRKVILFCHDPTALPFLAREPAVAQKLSQIELTIIGHLHSNLILWKSRWLAGLPPITFLGHTAKRLSRALRDARSWQPFNVHLCPSLAGIELLKDGGYLGLHLDPTAATPARVERFRLPR